MRWKSLFLYLSILSTTLAAAVPNEEKPCTLHHNGKYYDLNPLTAGKDYELKSTGGKPLVLNVCKPISHETWALKGIEDPSNVAGFVRKAHGDFSIGTANTTLLPPSSPTTGGGIKIQYINGSPCQNDHGSTVIEFICDTGVYDVGKPRLVAQIPVDNDEAACGFVFEWKTKFACPTSEGGGIWGFFVSLVVILLIFLMIYIVLGTLYNRFVLNLTGFDQIPQFSFESMRYHGANAVEWLRETGGRVYEAGKNGGWGGVLGRGGYSNYNQYGNGNGNESGFGGGNENENGSEGRVGGGGGRTNPVSHQSQVDTGTGKVGQPQPGNERGGFVRPTRGVNLKSNVNAVNPVSHQSQVPQVQVPQVQAPQVRVEGGNAGDGRRYRDEGPMASTVEERTFMLGDDDDDEGTPRTPIPRPDASLQSQPQPPSNPQRPNVASDDTATATPPPPSTQSGDGAGAPELVGDPRFSGSAAAVGRGRDLGGKGTIRL